MFTIVITDKSHPPLHYVVLKLALGLGGAPEFWARLPSVLFGTSLVPIAYAVGRELRLRRLDLLLVLTLVTSSGFLIYYAQYARMFAALECFAALSLLLFIRLWRDFSWRTWGLLTVVNSLMVYSHYWGWLAIATQCVLMAVGQGRKAAAMMVLSGAVTGLVFLPWAVLVALAALRLENLAGQIAWMGNEVPGVIDGLWLFAAFNGFIPFEHAARIGLVLFALPIAAFCLRFVRDSHRETLDLNAPGFWIVMIAGPILLTMLGSMIGHQNLWGERHLSILALPYYLLIGLSLSRLEPRLLAHVLRAAILVWAIAAAATYLARDDKKFHWERVVAEITARAPTPVYVSGYFTRLPLAYYLDIPVTEELDLKAIPDDRFWYIYRDTSWNGVRPEVQFAGLGYTAEPVAAIHWWDQTVTALLVQKPRQP
jgi:4-amino-4-deoxy-L-arabinose transferase-like glycosyltransferase